MVDSRLRRQPGLRPLGQRKQEPDDDRSTSATPSEGTRKGLLRETALLSFWWVPNIRKALDYVADLLLEGAGAQPLDPKLFGESIRRAKLRAIGRELRHLQDCAAEVADEPRPGDPGEEALEPEDRQLFKWAEEERRAILRIAVRIERRVGTAPEVRPGAETSAHNQSP